jgi:hypothetical protein
LERIRTAAHKLFNSHNHDEAKGETVVNQKDLGFLFEELYEADQIIEKLPKE